MTANIKLPEDYPNEGFKNVQGKLSKIYDDFNEKYKEWFNEYPFEDGTPK